MTKNKLWAHQLECCDRAKRVDHWALLFEMGAGKTATVIEIVKEKCRQNGRQLKILVLAPSVVLFNWKKEIANFWPELKQEHCIVLHGTSTDRRKQLDRTPNYFVVIANYETLLMDSCWVGLKRWSPDVIIADESHRLKNPKAQRTKRALLLADGAKYRYILSGTPVTNSEHDLFSQYLFLDRGETFGKSYFNFRNAWFTDANAEIRKFSPAVKWPKWIPKKHLAEEFRTRVMAKAMSVRKEDCMDLPPYVQTTLEVGMSREQRSAYAEMKKDFLTFVGSKAFSAELAVTKALRLLQVTSGYLMNAEGETHIFKNTPKEQAMLDLIEESSTKIIVWCPWRAMHKHLSEVMTKKKINHRMLVGDQGAKERDDAINQFTDDASVQVMLASQGAGGIGINLVAANKAIYFGRNFSFEQDAQSAARIHRGGQKADSVTRYDLIIPDTIDQSCMEALARKEELKDSIVTGGLKV